MGLLWMRTSAEYRALAYQGYNVAMNLVKMAVADLFHQRKPLAIVLDADETVVDNTKLMGESIANGNGRFDAPWWRQAVHQGKSQKTVSETQYYEDLDNLKWYAYDDNFGTSEDKLLVKALKELMPELESNWTDIYLLRNEKAVRIYNFSDGQAFEPDFLLLQMIKRLVMFRGRFLLNRKGVSFLMLVVHSKIVKKVGKRNFCLK